MGFARAAETMIRDLKGLEKGEKLGTGDKVLASAIGGTLGRSSPSFPLRALMGGQDAGIILSRSFASRFFVLENGEEGPDEGCRCKVSQSRAR